MFKKNFCGKKNINNLSKGECMKRNIGELSLVKEKISSLKGEMIAMSINRGRKKIDNVSAVVKDVYPSVFTVRIENARQPLQTFSYFDILCGNVKIE